ncbi:hypothetical protein Goshw_027010, partial [Gossypium schwendimanii]|nr:hypothetical protein [Gossypium schwendimanii]
MFYCSNIISNEDLRGFICNWNGSSSLGPVVGDISHKCKGSSRKFGESRTLVWCLGCFLHFQFPHGLEPF